MAYNESQLDKANTQWFHNDKTRNTLVRLTVSNGSIRSITPVEIDFDYPITAIVGENGAGKSTILALAACAFHNNTAFFPQNRIRNNVKKPRNYYTYGDFFTFSPDETGLSGIEVWADYLSQNGIEQDIRRKKPSGKWNDFNTRPKRAVAYLGINRIVPPSESNPHRHYCRNFINNPLDEEQLNQLKCSMTAIIGRNYTDIELKSYSIYRLFEATRNGITYTGFNMGAGENAVLVLLLEILSAGPGALIVVDEIELGLHTQAQIRLIEELKIICKKYKTQIICSTHSKDILSCLPPEARLFIKRSDGHSTDIIPKISPDYAFGKLSGMNSNELSVFVEDEVGQAFLENVLPQSLRERIRIIPIGSDQAVLKHMAVHYREGDLAFTAFLDGDKRTQKENAIRKIENHLEARLGCTEEFVSRISSRLNYIPGTEWPEKVLIEQALHAEDMNDLCLVWDIPKKDIQSALEQALTAGKHNEFYSLSQSIHLPLNQVRTDIIRFYKKLCPDSIEDIITSIQRLFS